MTSELVVRTVGSDDAGELFTLRRAAFVSEAQQYDDPHIAPLTQTLDELVDDLARDDVITLGAWSGPRLVGSIRVLLEPGKATLGRFAVAPDLHGKGIGSRLLVEVVPRLPEGTQEVWVFTGRDSLHNLAFYTAQGYEHQHDQRVGDLTYAYLRRMLGTEPGRTLLGCACRDWRTGWLPGKVEHHRGAAQPDHGPHAWAPQVTTGLRPAHDRSGHDRKPP